MHAYYTIILRSFCLMIQRYNKRRALACQIQKMTRAVRPQNKKEESFGIILKLLKTNFRQAMIRTTMSWVPTISSYTKYILVYMWMLCYLLTKYLQCNEPLIPFATCQSIEYLCYLPPHTNPYLYHQLSPFIGFEPTASELSIFFFLYKNIFGLQTA